MTIIGIFSFITSLLIMYFSQRYFVSNNLFDTVLTRSSHNVQATRNGGLSICLTLLILTIYFYLTANEVFNFSLIIPLGILFTIGFYDDLYQVDFKLKFIFQIIAAKIFIDNGFIIENLHGVFGVYELGRIVAQALTIFIIVAIINAINFIDGIDGLALSVCVIFLVSFSFFASSTTPFDLLSKILVFSLLPLYYFNFKPRNKIFLGDSGSLFLGGVISVSVIYILSNDYIIKPQYDIHKILFVLSILIYPIVDIIRVFFIRILNGRSPFEADNNHIHHFLLRKSNSHIKTSSILVCFSIIFLIFIQVIF